MILFGGKVKQNKYKVRRTRETGKENDIQRPRGKRAPNQQLLPHAHMQPHQHRHRQRQHQKIREHVQQAIRQIQLRRVYALGVRRTERVPPPLDGMAFEDQREAERDHVADCDEEDEEDGEPEGAVRVDAQVVEEDGDFGEAGGGDVDYDVGGAPLGGWEVRCGGLGREGSGKEEEGVTYLGP